jgi:hypothetical protein
VRIIQKAPDQFLDLDRLLDLDLERDLGLLPEADLVLERDLDLERDLERVALATLARPEWVTAPPFFFLFLLYSSLAFLTSASFHAIFIAWAGLSLGFFLRNSPAFLTAKVNTDGHVLNVMMLSV